MTRDPSRSNVFHAVFIGRGKIIDLRPPPLSGSAPPSRNLRSATTFTRHVSLPAVFVPESNHVTQLVDDHAEDGAMRTEGDDLTP